MIATVRTYQETHLTGGPTVFVPVSVAPNWATLISDGWGQNPAETVRNWYEVHHERLVEVDDISDIS